MVFATIYLIGFVCILIMVVLLRSIPKRTLYGDEMLGKINGFKNFIETAEKSKIEELVK